MYIRNKTNEENEMNAINWTENAEKKLAEYKEDIIEMIEAGLDENKAIEIIRKESTINENLFDKMIEEITQAQKTMKLYRQGYRWEAFKSYQADETATNPSMTILQFIGKMENMIREDDAMERCYSVQLASD